MKVHGFEVRFPQKGCCHAQDEGERLLFLFQKMTAKKTGQFMEQAFSITAIPGCTRAYVVSPSAKAVSAHWRQWQPPLLETWTPRQSRAGRSGKPFRIQPLLLAGIFFGSIMLFFQGRQVPLHDIVKGCFQCRWHVCAFKDFFKRHVVPGATNRIEQLHQLPHLI